MQHHLRSRLIQIQSNTSETTAASSSPSRQCHPESDLNPIFHESIPSIHLFGSATHGAAAAVSPSPSYLASLDHDHHHRNHTPRTDRIGRDLIHLSLHLILILILITHLIPITITHANDHHSPPAATATISESATAAEGEGNCSQNHLFDQEFGEHQVNTCPSLSPTTSLPSFLPSTSSSFSSSSSSSTPTPRLYVISVIFNPKMYTSRIDLFQAFDRHMASTPGVVHITAECIFPSQGQTQFTVTQPDNPNHYQLTSDSVLWVKEDLINYAVRHLPADAEYVAWIDADLTFQSLDWPQRTMAALQQYAVVQVFSFGDYLGPNGTVIDVHESMGHAFYHNATKSRWPHPGYGWAMRRETFEAMHGLPDFHIVGNSDLDLAYCFAGREMDFIQNEMTRNHPGYVACAERKNDQITSALVETVRAHSLLGRLGYIDVNVSHHWHGTVESRGFVARQRILVSAEYNPETDLIGYGNSMTDQPLVESDGTRVVQCPGDDQSWGQRIRQLRMELIPNLTRVTREQKNDPVIRSAIAHKIRMRGMQNSILDYFAGRKEND